MSNSDSNGAGDGDGDGGAAPSTTCNDAALHVDGCDDDDDHDDDDDQDDHDDDDSSSSDEDESGRRPGKKGSGDVDYSSAPAFEMVLLTAVKFARAQGATEDTTVRLVMTIASQYCEAILPTRSSIASKLPDEDVVNLARKVANSAVEDAAALDGHRISTRDITIRGQTILSVPNDHEIVYKPLLSNLKNLAELGKNIRKATTLPSVDCEPDRHNFGPMSRVHVGDGLMEAPQLSLYSAEQAIPNFIAGWLSHVGIPLDPEQIAATCPSVKTLDDIVVDGTRDSILLLERELKDAVAIFIACDKGNRKGIAHLPKVLSWWCSKQGCVRSACIDADGSGSSSKDCAEAIRLSLKKFQNTKIILRGQATDAGGGGVTESLAKALKELGLTEEEYAVANCTLHALQMAFANPIKEIFGEGGLDRRNVMQLIHSCYDLQSCFEKTEGEMKWEIANGAAPDKAISKAVLTRWWHVNTAAQHLKNNWQQWRIFATGCLNATTADTAPGKISSSILSLMEEPKIYCDLLFICGYSKAFFVPHMEWLQDHDAIAGDFGYRARDMPVRAYIIVRDLTKMSTEWENMAEFKEFVDAINEFAPPSQPEAPAPAPEAPAPIPEPTARRSGRSRMLSTLGQIMEDQRAADQAQREARTAAADAAADDDDDGVEEQPGENNATGNTNAEDGVDVVTDEGYFRRSSDTYTHNEIKNEIKLFFDEAIKMAKKHFARWSGDLLHVGLAGEKESASALARAFAGKTVEGSYESTTHGCTIDVADMTSYLVENAAGIDIEEVKKRKLVSDHWHAISNHMAEGEDLWSSTIPVMLEMRSDAENTILPLASSTHRVEAQVRECSLVSSTNRGEVKRSDYIIQRSTNTSSINRQANKTREGRVLHANASVTAGVPGQRQMQSGGAEDPKKKTRQNVRGEARTVVQLQNARDRYQKLNRIQNLVQKQKELKTILKRKDENRSDMSRATEEAKKFRRKYLLSRAPNKRQKERGVDRTYLVVGRIPYKSLRAIVSEHMHFLHAELAHRGTDAADIPTGFRERIKMLKEMENDVKSFRAQTQVNFEL
mgnify:CR=1 FL=1